MSWQVVVDVPAKGDAESVKALIDMALDNESILLENIATMHIAVYEVCEVDFMAGQLCRLPAGHDDGHR